MKRLTEAILYAWFLIVACEAPLRLLCVRAGVPSFIYVKDVLLVGLFVYFIIYTTSVARINKVVLTLFALGLYGLVVGLINGLDPLQVLFGLKILLTLFVGFLAVYVLGLETGFFVRLFRVFVPIVLAGIVLDLLFKLPWTGLEYEAFGVSIEASRRWWVFGMSRLGGFGRASFETAIMLFALCALYLTTTCNGPVTYGTRARVYDVVLLILSFAGIVLTTAKTSILAFVILFVFYVLARIRTGRRTAGRALANVGVKVLMVMIFLYGLIPPVLALESPTSLVNLLHTDSGILSRLAASYVLRMEEMWPRAFQLLSEPYMVVTGRGLGGIGMPQKYFEPGLANAADNVWVYLVVDFGIIVLGLLVAYLLHKILFLRLSGGSNLYFFAFCMSLFAYGATLNVIESPTLMMTLGFLLAFWKRPDMRVHAYALTGR
ncbi:MAG TPA: hypothetical protein VMY05_04750 [Acidobacteriota bacterium]|nr:hypothetical protein [Acidobacteriota bacterium]